MTEPSGDPKPPGATPSPSSSPSPSPSPSASLSPSEDSSKAPPPANSPTPTPHQSWARSVMWILIVFIVTVNGLLVLKTCSRAPADLMEKTGNVIQKAGQAVRSVVAAFNQGHVTTEFISYATSIDPTHRLQFATVKQTDIFTRSDQPITGFGYIPLPEVIVEARAPVEYTYFLDLNAEWKLVLQDGVIHVLAPKIQFNQPAVDVSAIQYEVKKGSLFRNKEEVMTALRQSITQLSRMKARENIALVKETGRRQTTEFVERWLSKSFTDGKQYPVKVYFPGEPLPETLRQDTPAPLAPESRPPQ